TLDVAKSACERIGRPVVVVPTQLTADGIASPVAVIRGESGRFESGHARLPIAVAVDMDLVARAPADRARAGLGDLLANPRALQGFGLAQPELAAVVRAGPATRPGRYTVLDEADLSDAALQAVLEEVLAR